MFNIDYFKMTRGQNETYGFRTNRVVTLAT